MKNQSYDGSSDWEKQMKRKARSISLASPRHQTFSILFCFVFLYFVLHCLLSFFLIFHSLALALSCHPLYCTVLYCTVLLKHQTLHHFHSFLLLCFLLFSRPLPLLLFLFFCSTLLRCTSLSLCGMHVMSVFVCHMLPSTSSILSCMHS